MDRIYELTVVLQPDLESDLEKAASNVEKILADNKAKVEKKDVWGKQRLAYSIQKQDHGLYVYYELTMDPQVSAKIQSLLNITDDVMRYLLVEKDLRGEELARQAKEAAAKRASSNQESQE